MKVCSCRDFDCTAAGKAIKDHKPARAEDVHRIVAGEPPRCGSCLPRVQAMMDEFNITGHAPCPLQISSQDMEKAERAITERFEKEVAAGDTAPYKQRFARRKGNKPGISSAA